MNANVNDLAEILKKAEENTWYPVSHAKIASRMLTGYFKVQNFLAYALLALPRTLIILCL